MRARLFQCDKSFEGVRGNFSKSFPENPPPKIRVGWAHELDKREKNRYNNIQIEIGGTEWKRSDLRRMTMDLFAGIAAKDCAERAPHDLQAGNGAFCGREPLLGKMHFRCSKTEEAVISYKKAKNLLGIAGKETLEAIK